MQWRPSEGLKNGSQGVSSLEIRENALDSTLFSVGLFNFRFFCVVFFGSAGPPPMGRLIEKPEKAVVTMEKPEKGSVTMETLHQNEGISLAERRISLFSFASAYTESP